MTTAETIENKISTARKNLKILERYKGYSRQEIEDDIDIRGAVERYLYLAAQATIDVAGALVSYRNLRKPTTFSEAFYILQEDGVIGADFADTMVRMTGFRNAIAHNYDNLDYDIVYDVLQNQIEELERFLHIAEQNL